MVAVDAGVEVGHEGAGAVDAQFVPDAAGADVDDAGSDADGRDALVGRLARHRLDELDGQGRLDHVDVVAQGQLANGVLGPWR